MARATALPILSAESGLSRYLEEIRRFPMLEPQEEYMLAKSWREHGDREAAHRLVTSRCAASRSPCSRQRFASIYSSSGCSMGNCRICWRYRPSPPSLATEGKLAMLLVLILRPRTTVLC